MANITEMNKILTIFLMTEKGYHFLVHTAKKYQALFGLVVVGNDKSLQKDYEEEIITFCQQQQIPFVKKSDFKAVTTEYVMAIAWRWMIKHSADKLIVFHDSLLPKYRGFSPLINALLNKEKEIGVSAIFGADEFDRGAMIAQSATQIRYPIKIADAIRCINNNYLEVAETVLACLLAGKALMAVPQNEAEASYSIWRDERDYAIDWRQSADEICRLIDAVGYPYKGAYTRWEGQTVRIYDAVAVNDVKIEQRHCGKLIFVDDAKPVIICGTGLLKIMDAEIEDGDKRIPFFPLSKFRIRFTD